MSKKSAPASFRMNQIARAARAFAVLATVAAPGWALAQLVFPTEPLMNSATTTTTTTTTSSVPPNIVLTLDNSSSMTATDATSPTGASISRITALKNAVNAAFSQDKYLGKFRLAYQSMWKDAGFGPNRLFKSGGDYDNAMHLYTPAFRTQFLNWNNSLAATGASTPSQFMFAYGGEYLRGNWSNSYWSFMPIGDAYSPWKGSEYMTDTLNTAPDPAPLACRRAYFIFMTDGMWNSFSGYGSFYQPAVTLVGGSAINYDSTTHALPDGNTYTPAYPIYYDGSAPGFAPPPSGTTQMSTMADFALYYWSTNLSGNPTLGVVPEIAVTGSQTIGTVTYPEYWNPQNDPATWQHMQTFTIGFGTYLSGSGVAGAGQVPGFNGYISPASGVGFSSFFLGQASGTAQWPAGSGNTGSASLAETCANCNGNLLDLVHAAYNGRGKFYQATTQDALTHAFDEILQTATNTTSTSTTGSSVTNGIASAGGSSTRLAGGMAYTASFAYDPTQTANGLGGWSGLLQSYAGNNLGGAAVWTAITPANTATRSIFTANPGVPPVGAAFAASSLPTTMPLGDIVNSQLAFVGKGTLMSLNAGYLKFAKAVNTFRSNLGTVYVGANDGMMHAFDAGSGTPGNPGTGNERFAYVPLGLKGSMSAFGPSYTHRYWVDGGMFSGDAQLDHPTYATIDYSVTSPTPPIPAESKNWATVLAGTLGAGGPGYFVLDVTDPSQTFSNTTTAVLADTTGTTDANIGYQFGQPVMDQYNSTLQSAQIVKINTTGAASEWAVIMGNGYNSTSGLPVLLIQSLTKPGRPLYKIQASCTTTPADCLAKGNGLGQPRAVDVDGNGTADIVYAGDLMGNLWKFDISDPEYSSAHPEKWAAGVLFRAVGPTGQAQPITSAPVVVPNKDGGFMVGFGTGKNLSDDDTKDAPDPATAPLNSFYALYDNQPMEVSAMSTSPDKSRVTLTAPGSPFCNPSGPISGRYTDCLHHRTFGILSAVAGPLSAGATDVPNLSEQIGGTSTSTQKRGWYYDIPETDNFNTGKVLSNPIMLSDNIVLFFADNVASSTTTGSGPGGPTPPPPPPPPASETCEVSTSTTTTAGTTVSPPMTSVNYFNLMSGAAPDNITITVGTTHYVFDNKGGTGAGSGNRFRVEGVTKFIRSGTDGLAGMPGGVSFQNQPRNTPGRRAGWRFSR